MSRNPALAEVINSATEGALDGLFVSLPGRVVRYDSARQEADVQPIPKVPHVDEFGETVVEQLPVIPSVPVMFPGGGGFVVSFPIAVGDTVLLVFSGASMDKWLESTAEGPLDPETHARHSLADAVAIPGLRNFKRARSGMPTNHIRVGTEGGTFQGAALGETLATFLGTLKTWLDTHVHSGGTLGGSLTGVPNVLSGSVPSVASATVKVTP